VIEHKAVLDTCKEMENRGWEVTYLSVNKEGLIDLDNLKETIRDDTVLITIMHANNEIGVMNDIFSIGEICLERDICFLSDAAQSFGKLPIDLEAMHIDMLAVSGHKIYGPKGIGFLYVRQRNPKVELKLQIEGGGHERGMRSGTLPVPLIVGLGEASRLCFENMDAESKRLRSMRDKLVATLTDELPDTIINGSMEQRLPHNVNFSFPHVEGEALLMKLESIACSSGSACTSATLQPSYVMKALGHSEELAHSSIRIAFGRMNKEDDTEIAAKEIIDAVTTLREKSPFHRTAKSQPA
jgi:cysteine desulfurase